MSPVQKLSSDAKSRIKAISGPRPARYFLTAAMTWLTIAIVIAAAIYIDNIFVTLAAIYIVATRQNIFALLIHEQAHSLGIKAKYGDMIANLIVAYPLLVTSIEGYAEIHLRHHRNFFTPKDPDFLRKTGANWSFPMATLRLLGLFMQDISGISIVKYVMNRPKFAEDDGFYGRKHPTPKWVKPAFLLSVAVVLTLVHGWVYFLIYWVVPLFTVFPAIVRWGAICEHIYGEEGASVEETSPIIMPTLMGKIFLPNLNFTMHPYHHYFPGVSFSKLPEMHKIFEDEGLVYKELIFKSQSHYLWFILNRSNPGTQST